MVGDIVKVTPSSKMVGDFAIFMVQNDLTPENIYEKATKMSFPDSVVAYFKGMMGQPMGGFPQRLQKLVLKGEEPITCRAGELLPDEDFDMVEKHLIDKFDIVPNKKDILSYSLYPEVFDGYIKYIKEFGDLSRIGSDVFFHGLNEGETCEAEIADGKTHMIKLLHISKLDLEGNKVLIFEVDGNRREIKIKDRNNKVVQDYQASEMADSSNPLEVGSPIPGTVISILVAEGDTVTENQPIMVVEAMKMETRVIASVTGRVESINVKEGQQVKAGELLLNLK